MAQDIGSAGTSRRAAPRDHLAAIVESSDDAIISEDLNGIITSWNAGAQRLYGYTAEETIGCPASILVPAPQQDEIPSIIERLRRGERVGHYEAVRQAKNGQRLVVSLTVSAIRGSDGRIIGASEVGRDNTQRKQAEQDLARQLMDQQRLREMSSRLSLSGDTQTLYRELIDAAMEIMGAACGTMQTVDGETGELCLLETHGIPQQMRNDFARVSPGAATSCGEALRRGERVLVDYADDARVAGTEDARAHLDAGIRSAQSTPLVARSGRLVGMLTTQWRRSSPIADRQLYLLDILARQASDVIERVQTEETLRQNDERLRFTLEATEFGSWELDLSEAKPSATRRSLKHDEIFGYDQAVPTWNYDIFLEHVLEEDRDHVSRQLDEALHETGRWEFECRIRRADTGQVRWIWARGQVIEAWCKPRRMLGLVQDITERKDVEQKLRESEARERARADELAALLESVPAVVWIGHDPECRRITGSRAGYELLGMSPDSNMSLSAPESERPKHFACHSEGRRLPPDELPLQRATRGEVVRDYEMEIRFTDGVKRHLFGNAVPLRDEQGQVRGAVGAFIDVTQARRIVAQLEELTQTLEQRVMDRTAEAKQRARQLQLMAKELTDAEHRERRRLAQLLHDDLQQILVASKMRLRSADHPAAELIDQAIQTTRSLSTELAPPVLFDVGLRAGMEWLARWVRGKYQLEVDVRSDGSEPVEDEQLRVLLFEAVRELLLNVVKHSGVAEASVTLRRHGQQVEVQVEDSGAGFDPVARRASANPSGFGLFSLQERLELIGGHVQIDSAPGKGTRIGISLAVPSMR